jgi:hypothetical protein
MLPLVVLVTGQNIRPNSKCRTPKRLEAAIVALFAPLATFGLTALRSLVDRR